MSELRRGVPEAERKMKPERPDDALRKKIFPPENQPPGKEWIFDTFNPVIDRMNLLHADKRLELSSKDYAQIQEELVSVSISYQKKEKALIADSRPLFSNLKNKFRVVVDLFLASSVVFSATKVGKELLAQPEVRDDTQANILPQEQGSKFESKLDDPSFGYSDADRARGEEYVDGFEYNPLDALSPEETKLAKQLEDLVGRDIVLQIISTKAEAGSDALQETVFEGMDKLDTIASDKDMTEILDAMPLFYRQHIHTVTYIDKLIPMHSRYGVPGYEAGGTDGEGTIDLSKGCISDDRRETRNFIQKNLMWHEVAHNVDPIHNKRLEVVERLGLLQELIDRVTADNRLRSSYVESIHNDDPQKELLMKAKEYWAELNTYYFNEWLYDYLGTEDVQLVEKVLKLSDPNTDPTFARIHATEKQLELNVKFTSREELSKGDTEFAVLNAELGHQFGALSEEGLKDITDEALDNQSKEKKSSK